MSGLIDPFADGSSSPTPAPVAPQVVVVQPSAPAWKGRLELAAIVALTFTVAVLLTVIWMGPRGSQPAPTPATAVKLGRSFAPILAGTLAEGFDEGATQLRAGKQLGEADTALKATFDKARKAAFDQHVGGAIHAIAPDGSDLEPSQRDAMIGLFTGFAKGLREAK